MGPIKKILPGVLGPEMKKGDFAPLMLAPCRGGQNIIASTSSEVSAGKL